MRTIYHLSKLIVSALEAYEGLERRRVLRREGGGGGTDPPDVGCILVSFDSPFVGNIKRVKIRERVSIKGLLSNCILGQSLCQMITNGKHKQNKRRRDG